MNDGSCVANIQVVVDPAAIDEQTMRQVTTGACIRAEGRLVASPGSGQGVELQASSIGIYGPALDRKGNSVAGIQLLERLSRALYLSIF